MNLHGAADNARKKQVDGRATVCGRSTSPRGQPPAQELGPRHQKWTEGNEIEVLAVAAKIEPGGGGFYGKENCPLERESGKVTGAQERENEIGRRTAARCACLRESMRAARMKSHNGKWNLTGGKGFLIPAPKRGKICEQTENWAGTKISGAGKARTNMRFHEREVDARPGN
jgi:hypothetical protein